MAVHIADMREALESGTVPGGFTVGREAWEFPTLAYLDARGATRLWSIRVRLLHAGGFVPIAPEMLAQPVPALDDHVAEIAVEARQEGGKLREMTPTYVNAGRNLGKKNATNAITQAIRDALGLYNRQLKRADIVAVSAPAGAEAPNRPGRPGNAESAAEAKDPGGFDPTPPPMLARKLDDSRDSSLSPEDFARGITAQPKLNGVHLVVYSPGRGSRLIRYSRTGTDYPGQEQLVAEMLPWFAVAPPVAAGAYGVPAGASPAVLRAYGDDPAPYFAGELYLHGRSLNWIVGQARRGDDEGALEFHVFDVFFPHAIAAGHDMESRHRQAYIDAFFAAADGAGLPHPHVVRVPNRAVASMDDLLAASKEYLAAGYEGAIARKDWGGYRFSHSNYHSANVIKIKPKLDAEFPVVGFTQGSKGKDVGAVVWVCEVPDPVDPRDATFNVVPKEMTYELRKALFRCLGAEVVGPDGRRMSRFERDVKGLPLTVEFAERSAKTGKPLQAKALTFRTYEGGPDTDPVRRLIAECAA